MLILGSVNLCNAETYTSIYKKRETLIDNNARCTNPIPDFTWSRILKDTTAGSFTCRCAANRTATLSCCIEDRVSSRPATTVRNSSFRDEFRNYSRLLTNLMIQINISNVVLGNFRYLKTRSNCMNLKLKRSIVWPIKEKLPELFELSFKIFLLRTSETWRPLESVIWISDLNHNLRK